jgi:hypothetical protein
MIQQHTHQKSITQFSYDYDTVTDLIDVRKSFIYFIRLFIGIHRCLVWSYLCKLSVGFLTSRVIQII